MIADRIIRALGAAPPESAEPGQPIEMTVDHVDRRYRDAIKAGAEGLSPPTDDPDSGRRLAALRDPRSGTTFVIRADRR